MLLVCFVVFVVVEALLGARIWLQLSSAPLDGERARMLLSVTTELAAPFEALTHRPLLDRAGVVDFTALVAMEAYLVAMLALVVVSVFLGRFIAFVRKHVRLPWVKRRRRLPDGRLLRRVAVAGNGASYAFLVGPPAKVEPLIPRRRPMGVPIRRRAS